jgi:hypothetical protein
MQNSLLQWFARRFMDRELSPRELLTARKGVYIGLILILFTGCFLWRRNYLEPQARELAMLEQSIGEVELSGRLMQLSLTGSRGIVTCWLWNTAVDKQKKNQWNEMEFLVRTLTKLQPHFTVPWLFQSWNLSYNVTAAVDSVPDKYFFITRGIELLWEGERQNQNNPDLRFSIGFYTQHKIAQSDQRNTLRSLLDLSKIPPSERDPSLFRKVGADGTEQMDWESFKKFKAFCDKYPQLIRRLYTGIRMETVEEQGDLFTCKNADDVVNFLRDNFNLPSLYALRDGKDVAREEGDRFPVLPPERDVQLPQHPFQPSNNIREFTDRSPLGDSVDAYEIARAWYGYAQEPIPEPCPPRPDRPNHKGLPGSSYPITNRSMQKIPRYMAIVIFRGYPCLGQSQHATRLQEEGWFDGEPWALLDSDVLVQHASDELRKELRKGEKMSEDEITKRIEDDLDKLFGEGKSRVLQVGVGKDVQLSRDAWKLAYDMWKRHGEVNNILLTDAELDIHKSDREFMADYDHYRSINNYAAHLNRSEVESQLETVQARKTFFAAETKWFDGRPEDALEIYGFDPKTGWLREKDDKVTKQERSVLYRWRDILSKYKAFREEDLTQEQAFELQLTFMAVLKKADPEGRLQKLRESISQKTSLTLQIGPGSVNGIPGVLGAVALAELRRSNKPVWSEPIPQMMAFVNGPFNVPVLDDQGREVRDSSGQTVYVVSDRVARAVLERKNVVRRPSTPPEQPVEQARRGPEAEGR